MSTINNAIKDAALTAIAAFALSLPLFGLRLEDSSNGLYLSFRFEWVIYVTLLVFIGRLILTIRFPGFSIRLPSFTGKRLKLYYWWMFAMAVAFPFIPGVDRNIIDKFTIIIIYIMLGWGLNIVVGLAGLLDLGYVAFYAVGAYSYALLSIEFGLSFWVCLPLAGFFAAIFGIMLGFPVLRLRGDYLAIVTLGFGEIIRVILLNWQDLTGGPNGITSIPRPTLFGFHMSPVAPEGYVTFHDFMGIDYNPEHRVIFLYLIILFLAILTNIFTTKLRRLPLGRAWEALREDEIACKALGLNPTNIKLSAFALGAMFAGFAGSFFATRQGFISPESFTFIESAIILAIVVLGGMGSQVGVVFAAAILIGIPEIFREFHQFRMLAFGSAMVLVMIWRPNGLIAHREPSIKLGSNL